jgi:hypothetical protein
VSGSEGSPLREAIEWANAKYDADYRRKLADFATVPGGSPSSVVGDAVNSPRHYTAYEGLEVIDLAEQMSFSRGNVVKYVARAGLKGGRADELEDLEKAKWYLDREIVRVRGEGFNDF